MPKQRFYTFRNPKTGATIRVDWRKKEPPTAFDAAEQFKLHADEQKFKAEELGRKVEDVQRGVYGADAYAKHYGVNTESLGENLKNFAYGPGKMLLKASPFSPLISDKEGELFNTDQSVSDVASKISLIPFTGTGPSVSDVSNLISGKTLSDIKQHPAEKIEGAIPFLRPVEKILAGGAYGYLGDKASEHSAATFGASPEAVAEAGGELATIPAFAKMTAPAPVSEPTGTALARSRPMPIRPLEPDFVQNAEIVQNPQLTPAIPHEFPVSDIPRLRAPKTMEYETPQDIYSPRTFAGSGENMVVNPPAIDTSYVRGVPAEFPEKVRTPESIQRAQDLQQKIRGPLIPPPTEDFTNARGRLSSGAALESRTIPQSVNPPQMLQEAAPVGEPFTKANLDTLDYYSEILANPELTQQGIPLTNADVAIPLGGTRISGEGGSWGTFKEAQSALSKLQGRPGFDNAKIEPLESGGFRLVWGKDLSPDLSEVAHGKAYGYSDRAIQKYLDYTKNLPDTMDAIPILEEDLKPLGRTIPAEIPQTPTELTTPAIPQESAIVSAEKIVSPQRVVEDLGLKFDGDIEGQTWFTDPETKSTLMMPTEGISPESVLKHVQESRARFSSGRSLQESKEITESPPKYRMAQRGEEDANLLDWKPKSQQLTWISPDEYFNRIGQSPEKMLENGLIDRDRVNEIKAKMSINKPMDATWWDITPSGKILGQEGRHRALAAKELGIDKIPVIEYLHEEKGSYLDREQPQNLTPEQSDFLAKGGKITKVPSDVPTEPVEFGRPLEEIKARAEKIIKTQGVSVEDLYNAGYDIKRISKTLGIPYQRVFEKLEKSGLVKGPEPFGGKKSAFKRLHEEESGAFDPKRIAEVINTVRKSMASADQFLDTNPETAPIAKEITNAEVSKRQANVFDLDRLSALKSKYKDLGKDNFSRLAHILNGEGVPNSPREAAAVADLRRYLDDKIEEAIREGATTRSGRVVGRLDDYFTHMRASAQGVQGLWEAIKSVLGGETQDLPAPEGVGVYNQGTSKPSTPFVEHRSGIIKVIDYDLFKILRRYTEGMNKVIYDKPAVMRSLKVLNNVMNPDAKTIGEWYIRNYVGYEPNGLLRTFKYVDRKLAGIGARSVLFGNTRLQALHAARLMTQVWPELGTVNTVKGLAEVIIHPQESWNRAREAGLLQQSEVPFNLKQTGEKLDALGNFMDIGNSFAKMVAHEGNLQKLKDAGDPNWERNAVHEAVRMEGMVTPARTIPLLEVTPRLMTQFKFWMGKYGELWTRALGDAVEKRDFDSLAKISRYAAGALMAYEISKKLGIATWHLGISSFELASSVTAGVVKTVLQDLAKEKYKDAMIEIVQWAVRGGKSIPRELKGPSLLHKDEPKGSRTIRQKRRDVSEVKFPLAESVSSPA